MEEKSTISKLHLTTDVLPLILCFCLISIYLLYMVHDGNFVFGSQIGNSTYTYFTSAIHLPIWLPILVIVLIAFSILLGRWLIVSHESLTLLIIFIVAIALQILINSARPVSLKSIIESDSANSFYNAALQYSPYKLISQYNSLAPELPLHARTNMPGKVLLYQIMMLITTSPDILGYLIYLISIIGGLFLYGICRSLFHDRQIAFTSFLLYVLIPCRLFFSPIPNTITPTLVLLCMYLLILYIEKKNIWFLAFLGLSLYLLVLFEPTPLASGLIFIAILLHALGKQQITSRDLWKIFLIPIISFAVIYLLFFLFLSFNLFSTLQYVVNDAMDFNSRTHRGYRIWVGENLKEFFFVVGTPAILILIFMGNQILCKLKELTVKITLWPLETILTASILLTLVVVDILGINRGEITRLWIYLAALVQIPVAFFISKNSHSKLSLFLVASTFAVQALYTLTRINFIQP